MTILLDQGRLSKFKGKKGQAALEFLMTYGWAILIVIGVISALAYTGILDFGTLIPDECSLTPGLQCYDFTYNGDRIGFVFENRENFDVKITNVAVGGCDPDEIINVNVPKGSTSSEIYIDCGVIFGDKINDVIIITYEIPKTGRPHSVRGTLRTRAENIEIDTEEEDAGDEVVP
ncbi:hypothetical protein ACFL1H_04985 [Nanoarchaeota archaeon]